MKWFVMDALGKKRLIEADEKFSGADHVSFYDLANGGTSEPTKVITFYAPAWVSDTDLDVDTE